MKRLFSIFLAVAVAANVLAQTATQRIADGHAALAAHDLPTAKQAFADAVALDATNQTAAALLGITRVFAIVARWGTVGVATPGPEYSKILPNPPRTVSRRRSSRITSLAATHGRRRPVRTT